VQNQHLPRRLWFWSATWHVNNGSFCLTAWNESQWTDLLGYSTVSKMLAAIKHIAAKITIFFVHATQSSSAAKKLFILLVLPPTIQC